MSSTLMSDSSAGSESADVDSDDEAMENETPRGSSNEAPLPRHEEEASVGYRLMGIEIFPPPYLLQPHMNETRRRLSVEVDMNETPRMPWRLTFALNSAFVRYELGALLATPCGPRRVPDAAMAAAASDLATEEVEETAAATPHRQNHSDLRVWCKVGGERVRRPPPPPSCGGLATVTAPPITPTNATRQVQVILNGTRCSIQPLLATFSAPLPPPAVTAAETPATRPLRSHVPQHRPTSPPPPVPETLGGAFGGFFTARGLPWFSE